MDMAFAKVVARGDGLADSRVVFPDVAVPACGINGGGSGARSPCLIPLPTAACAKA